MPYYEDLSPYVDFEESVPAGVTAVNVGWLESEEHYEEGEVPEGFIDALVDLVENEPRMRTRGWQECRLPHAGHKESYPIVFSGGGQNLILGDAEVRVVAESGLWMIAPNLILHYVSEHSYRPPAEFIEAVLRRRVAPAE